MIRNPRIRRTLSLALMVAGGVFIFLAPDDVALGVVLLALGLALEVAGMLVQRRSGG
jgi:drug/metabolite transporter (DMT)-like permease